MRSKKDEGQLGGMLGSRVKVRTMRNGVEVTNRPPKKRPRLATPGQAEAVEKFVAAARYAKLQTADPDGKALYSQGISDKKPTSYVVALCDYIKVPKVILINTETYDGSIGIEARGSVELIEGVEISNMTEYSEWIVATIIFFDIFIVKRI